MDDSAAGQDADPADSSNRDGVDIIEVAPDGDVLLDVTFETSKETLKAARKAAQPRPGQKLAQPALKPRVRLAYRVQLAVLKQHSKYFDMLLGNTSFVEAKSVTAAFEKFSKLNLKPSEADAKDLPLVKIHQDDEATQSAAQETIFQDLLRILHGKAIATKPVTVHYLATLALLADRFDCTAIVERRLTSLKYKWPPTQTRLSREEGSALTKAAEEAVRQKILVSWLIGQPITMQVATRELILYGSRKWSATAVEGVESNSAAWWDLPDDLESEQCCPPYV
jgi:hypothetical protein